MNFIRFFICTTAVSFFALHAVGQNKTEHNFKDGITVEGRTSEGYRDAEPRAGDREGSQGFKQPDRPNIARYASSDVYKGYLKTHKPGFVVYVYNSNGEFEYRVNTDGRGTAVYNQTGRLVAAYGTNHPPLEVIENYTKGVDGSARWKDPKEQDVGPEIYVSERLDHERQAKAGRDAAERARQDRAQALADRPFLGSSK